MAKKKTKNTTAADATKVIKKAVDKSVDVDEYLFAWMTAYTDEDDLIQSCHDAVRAESMHYLAKKGKIEILGTAGNDDVWAKAK